MSVSAKDPHSDDVDGKLLSRREALRGAGALGAAVALPTVFAGCLGGDDGAVSGGSAAGKPSRGGHLRVTLAGGGSAETLDITQAPVEIDLARGFAMYEGLTAYDHEGKTVDVLAESFEPNRDASVWQCRLRDGVTFHDGKPLTADDVVFTIRYWLDPSTKSAAKGAVEAYMGKDSVVAVNKRTVEFRLERPNSFLRTNLGDARMKILSEGTTPQSIASKPNGTGPFKFASWTRGERSRMVRYDDYWRDGRPYIDELTIVSINEPTARLNALVADQVDVIGQLDPKLVPTVEGNPALTLLEIAGGSFTPFAMNLQADPFTDNDVRQAFEYMIDRQAMIDSTLGGRGKLANDLVAWFDPDYASSIPQREHDPERAAALLKKAGRENLRVTLNTADAWPAMVEAATVFAEQAKAAGVTLDTKKFPPDAYFSAGGPGAAPYKQPLITSGAGGRPIVPAFNLQFVQGAALNETNWKRPAWDRKLGQAYAITDEARRHEIMVDLQQELWDEGGLIIWGFLPLLDATSSKVKGIVPSVIRNLGAFDFSAAWFA